MLFFYSKIKDTTTLTDNPKNQMVKIRPFLKWAGSKYNCLHEIVKALPGGHRLIEPFTGSGVVFMNTSYESYLLAEYNPDLVNFFSTLQSHGEAFIKECQSFFQPKYNQKDVYYDLRSQFNALQHSPLKSALFLYLNRHGYNGLCRYNSKGIFNVPFGLYKKPYFPYNEMLLFRQKSLKAQFIHTDFRETFKLAVTGDVIYCDPPYIPLSEKTRPLAYTQNHFKLSDQINLAELAEETAAKGIPVILSNHDTPFTREYYKNGEIKSFEVTRWINCQANKRRPVKEIIAVFSK